MRQTIASALGVAAALAAMTTWIPSAEAQYSGTLSGTSVTFTGGGGDDTLLTFANVGGVLTHNRSDAGFNSIIDMDTSVIGDQTILVASLTSLTINCGAGNDIVSLLGLSGATATITLNGEDGDDVLTGGPSAETINGGAGNDVIEAFGGTDTVFGGSGTDAIGLGTANGESNSVDGGSDVDTLVLLGDAGNNLFIISRSSGVLSISIDGNVSTATYSNLEVVSIAGTTGNDTFTVEPLDDLSYAIDGGADVDTLNVDANGSTVIQSSSSIVVGSNFPINHTNVETVNVTDVGFGLDDDDDGCGLSGLEALLVLALSASLRRRRV